MRKLALLFLPWLIACASHRIYISEGPPRIDQLKVPMMADVGQVVPVKIFMGGEVARLPFGDYVGVEVYADDELIFRKAQTLNSRFLTATIQFSPEFYRRKMGYGQPGGIGWTEVDPATAGLPPIEGVDEHPTNVLVNVRVFVHVLEIDYKNELAPIGVAWNKQRTLRLHCMHCECATIS